MLLMAYMWTVTAMLVLIISITVKAMINLPKHSADCLVCKALKSMKINLITILSNSAKQTKFIDILLISVWITCIKYLLR